VRAVAVTRRPPGVDRKTFAPRPADEPLMDDVVLVDVAARAVVGFQVTLAGSAAPWAQMVDALGGLAWNDVSPAGKRGGARLAGIVSPHRTFGYLPPQTLRVRYGAMAAGLTNDCPPLANALDALGARLWRHVCLHMPEAASAHESAVSGAIEPVWRMGRWFTSGILNRTVALPYHRDAANLPGCLSAMVCLRSGISGGHLHLPEYGVWLGVPDRSLVVFSGSTLMHGVTPLYGQGHRYTAVWYVRAGMRGCAPSREEEMRRAQLAATSHDQVPA